MNRLRLRVRVYSGTEEEEDEDEYSFQMYVHGCEHRIRVLLGDAVVVEVVVGYICNRSSKDQNDGTFFLWTGLVYKSSVGRGWWLCRRW